ncbi:Alpha/beta hydrolase fold-1 [Coprinopsis sp. MPI-PUGE-AT-0042]|nr:Alpha/beta hydrolase fold-1 [Coprinopsis sp. MPI-PUGE-AT-0042]
MVLSKETFTFDPRPNYPLLVTANRYWDDTTSVEDGLTVILAHGTSFTKETWEPTLDDLQELVQDNKLVRIREYWSIEAPNHGDSALLNEETLQVGYTPIFPWEEYTRCLHLFLMGFGTGVPVDFTKRDLVAIGHSMGAVSLVLTGGHYPRILFKSLVCCELMSMDQKTGKKAGELLSGGAGNRRDVWPSKEEAYKILKSRGTWKSWDERVLRNYVETGLKPTKEGDNGTGVTLKCSKIQESACYQDPMGSSRAYNYLPAFVKQVRTHLIYGAIDDYMPGYVKKDILQRVGGVQNLGSFARIPNAGHLAPQMNPSGLAKEIYAAWMVDYSSQPLAKL